MTWFYTAIGNVGRWLSEWADDRLDGGERHIIDMMRDAWVSK